MTHSPGPWTWKWQWPAGATEPVDDEPSDDLMDSEGESVGVQASDYVFQKVLVMGKEKGPYGDNLRLIAAAPRMREMLLRLEWAGNESVGTCPECGRRARPGHAHASDCELASLLGGLR